MKNEFILKAKENLKAAELLFENGLYNASANRSYYAALHAAVAALTTIGIKYEPISHKTTQANFSAELIQRRKVYPSRLKSYLTELQDTRNDADYRIKSVSKNLASKQLAKSKEFINQIATEVGDVQL
ncbi:MAG: hypothetical protein BWK80_44370 [Desulfobacteraceae bacterium IS3]|nr:MAG: hypothetical protein BWK80_44370 [Desulfobacteraceae bacterium IS3]